MVTLAGGPLSLTLPQLGFRLPQSLGFSAQGPLSTSHPTGPRAQAQLSVCTDTHTQQLGRRLASDTWHVDPNSAISWLGNLRQVTYPCFPDYTTGNISFLVK